MKRLFFLATMLTTACVSANTLTEITPAADATVCANLDEAKSLAVGTIVQVENTFYEVQADVNEAQVTLVVDETASDVTL